MLEKPILLTHEPSKVIIFINKHENNLLTIINLENTPIFKGNSQAGVFRYLITIDWSAFSQ